MLYRQTAQQGEFYTWQIQSAVFYSLFDDFGHSNAAQSNLFPPGLSDEIRSPGQPTLSLTSVGKNLQNLFTKILCLCQLCAVAFMQSISFVLKKKKKVRQFPLPLTKISAVQMRIFCMFKK